MENPRTPTARPEAQDPAVGGGCDEGPSPCSAAGRPSPNLSGSPDRSCPTAIVSRVVRRPPTRAA